MCDEIVVTAKYVLGFEVFPEIWFLVDKTGVDVVEYDDDVEQAHRLGRYTNLQTALTERGVRFDWLTREE